MVEKNNSTCAICGKGYYLCMACKSKIKAEPWKLHTDTAEHFKLFQILRGYSNGVYTREEMKKKFKMLNLDDYSTFRPSVKEQIDDILNESAKSEKAENRNLDSNKKEDKVKV